MTSKLPDADDVLPRDHPLRRLPGSVVSRVSGGFERMKEDISALFRGPVFPRPRPDPRPPHALLLSPAALSVLDGPSISRSEIERFKLDLQTALAEVNQSVEVSAKGRLSAYDSREEFVHIINLLEVHATDVKYAIDVGISSGKVSKEGAQELKLLIDHLVMSMRNVHQWKLNLSTSNLIALLGLPMRLGSLAKQVTSFVYFVKTVLLLRDVAFPPKNGTGLFRDIGKRAKAVLYEDYATAGLGMVLNSESTDKLSMIAGFKVTDQNIISRSFVKLKNVNLSVDMNAVLNGNSLATITLDDAWVSDTKCILSVPVPWQNSPKLNMNAWVNIMVSRQVSAWMLILSLIFLVCGATDLCLLVSGLN